MLELLNQKLVSLAGLHKNKSIWRKLVTVLASVAVFCVTYALILPAITAEEEVFCGLDEHEHTEACYTYEPRLICGYASETDILTGGVPGDASVEARETVIAAGPEESVAAVETVTEPEEAAAVITDIVTDSTMPVDESENEFVLIATEVKEPVVEYKTAPAAVSEQEESKTHVHTVDCYEYVKVLVCEKEEHIHWLQCYSDPDADVENADIWQHMADRTERSGDVREDVLSFARTQLGYVESEKNYLVLEDGESVHGYTRYGGWYGDPYGDWCAMFCSFCLHYSGVDDYPLEGNCQRWINVLSETYGENGAYYRPAGTYEPKPGDLIFFDRDTYDPAAPEDRIADHVGFVYERIEATDEKPAQIRTLEGNQDNTVCYRSYALTDTRIMGYGMLTDDEEIVIEREYKGEDFTVYVTYGKDAKIPAEAELTVRELMPGTEEFDLCYQQTLETLKAQDDQVEGIDFIRFFDVSFVDGGEEIEPCAAVNVRIVYDNPIMMDENTGEVAIHFADSGIELPETSATQSVDYAPENSVNTFEFTTESFSVVGAGTVTRTPQTGTFYQRVDSLTSGKTYLIVSAEGNMALCNNNTNYSAVQLRPVKNNEGYYTVSAVSGVTDQMRWTLEAISDANTNNNVFRLRNVARTTYYLRLGDGNGLISNGTGNQRNTKFTRNATTNTWTLNNNTYYLLNSGAAFSRSDSTSNVYRRNFIILEQVENKTLEIPDDVTDHASGSGEGWNPMVKPDYDPDTESITGAIRQDFTQTGLPTDLQNTDRTVKWSYASDPSTSDIEKYYQANNDPSDKTNFNYDKVMARDGMMLTDKSVIFGKDDYNAFSDYEVGEFSATLSAIGQDYHLQIADQVHIPVDIVFILDVSGSMSNQTGDGHTRRQAMVTAVNSAIKMVQEANPENRVGIALYSSGGDILLPLDHYTASDGNYVRLTSDGDVQPGENLQDSHNQPVPDSEFSQRHGTYTQYGIALGAGMLTDNKDTEYTAVLYSGTDYEKTVTVTREPVMILLSDGDPTHCNPNYTDVLNGPHYGSGVYTDANNRGVIGYYTILSANYYKRMVGIHYGVSPVFYTVGMGINATGYDDLSKKSQTGDHYKRAVLDPTQDNIKALTNTSAKNYATTAHELRDLLNGSATESSYKVDTTGSYNNLGRTQTQVPRIANPYSDYSYADGAHFGELTTADLTDIFNNIIASHIKVKTYGFMLNQRMSSGSMVTIIDPIGEGMEVDMESPADYPVLRYNGKNYAYSSVSSETVDGRTVITLLYNFTATTEDGSGGPEGERTAYLREIQVTITTAPDGKQTVKMRIPERDLPAFTPGPDESNYYYEELPVRLIYKIRLTEKSKAAVRNLKDGEELTFYTNEWSDDTNAYAVQDPHDDNPYYCDVVYYLEDGVTQDPNNKPRVHQYQEPFNREKSDNPTGTASLSFDSLATAFETSGAVKHDGEVHMALGNNGKLVFKASTDADLEVTKVWENANHSTLTEPGVDSITLQLLQNGEPYGAPVTVTAEDDWKHMFTDLPLVDSEGHEYVYTLEELDVFGFVSSVSELAYNSERGLYEVTVTNTKLLTRDLPVEKHWTDGGHSGHSVTVHLYADGEDTGLYKVLSQSNNWRDVFEGIPTVDVGGETISYTIREDAFMGYTASYTEGSIDFGTLTTGRWEQVTPGSFNASEVYQIRSANGNALTANGTNLQLQTRSDTNTSQQWRIVASGTDYTIQNVGSNLYIYFYQEQVTRNRVELRNSAQSLVIDSTGRIKIDRSILIWGYDVYLGYDNANTTISVSAPLNRADRTDFTFWRWVPDTDTRSGLIVTNSPRTGIEISADKIWQNVPNDARTEVTLMVYDVTISSGNAADTGRTLTLNSANGWHASIANLPQPAAGHTYAVVEAELPGFVASYDHEGTIMIGGKSAKAWYTGETPGTGELLEVEVTNVIGVALPQTGGIGTHLYTIGGLLLTASAAMYIFIVRRRRERSGFN